MNVIIVTPTYNERENIERLLPRLLAHGPNYRVLVVDDSSPDGTGDFVEEYSLDEPRVTLLRRPTRDGLGRAYVAGYTAALMTSADYIVQMDADFSHDPDFVPTLAHVAQQTGADLVVGSRYIAGARIDNWPRRRALLSRLGNLYTRLVLGTSISDYTTGFTVARADALRRLRVDSLGANGFAFLLEFKHAFRTHGMSIAEIPITFVERERGKSKLHTGIIGEALTTVWRIRKQQAAPSAPPILRPGIAGGTGEPIDER